MISDMRDRFYAQAQGKFTFGLIEVALADLSKWGPLIDSYGIYRLGEIFEHHDAFEIFRKMTGLGYVPSNFDHTQDSIIVKVSYDAHDISGSLIQTAERNVVTPIHINEVDIGRLIEVKENIIDEALAQLGMSKPFTDRKLGK